MTPADQLKAEEERLYHLIQAALIQYEANTGTTITGIEVDHNSAGEIFAIDVSFSVPRFDE